MPVFHASDPAWARRVNDRWIVHEDLASHAAAYLDHLERSDPSRLQQSCERARRLLGSAEPMEDPKPWFYSGLFSLARPKERQTFLSAHPFLQTVLKGVPAASLRGAGEATWQKIHRLQAALASLEQK